MKNEVVNIFMDTSVFIRHGFNMNCHNFQKLSSLYHQGYICIYLTEINYLEVKSNIEIKCNEAVSELKRFEKKGRIFNTIANREISQLVNVATYKDLKSSLESSLKKFMRDNKVSFISNSKIDIRKVFKNYFSKNPPFGDGKKKSEFPDAFMVAALESWCTKNKTKIHLISSDNDAKKACQQSENIIHLNNLEELFDKLASSEKYRHNFATETIIKNEIQIKEMIKEFIESAGFQLEGVDGEVNFSDVENIEFLNILITDLTENLATATININVFLNAEVEYYDSCIPEIDCENYVVYKTREYDTVDIIDREIRAKTNFTFRYDIHNKDTFEIEDFFVDFNCFIKVLG